MADEIPMLNPDIDLEDAEIETYNVIIDHQNPNKRRKITIRSPNVIEISEITRNARKGVDGTPRNDEFLISFIATCAINPELTIEQARRLIKNRPANRLKSLNEAIAKCCGVDLEELTEANFEKAVANL